MQACVHTHPHTHTHMPVPGGIFKILKSPLKIILNFQGTDHSCVISAIPGFIKMMENFQILCQANMTLITNLASPQGEAL